MTYILGVDLGTTSMSALVYQQSVGIIYKTSKTYPLITNQIGKSEQDPNEWINALDYIIEDSSTKIKDFSEKLSSICVSGQMHTLVPLDSKGKVIRPAILWNDTRSSKEVAEINTKLPILLEETQNKALEGFTLPKILWLRNNEPDNFKLMRTFLMPKDFINYYMTGEIKLEETDASGTIMYNIRKREWSQKISHEFGLDNIEFPKVIETGEMVGIIKKELSVKWRIPDDVEIIAGAADNVSSALGVGLYDDSKSMLSLGTSGVYLSLEEKFRTNDGRVHFFNYADNLYYSMGVTLAAGKSLSWYKDIFLPNISYRDMMLSLEKSPIGANGIIFTPYIQGERTPHTSDQIRGSFIGLDVNNNRDDFTRSVIEGISYSLKECQELMISKGQTKKELIVTGGGAKSELWLQMLSDIMNQTVCSVEIEEGAALGAIIIASVSTGIYNSYQESYLSLNSISKRYHPIKDNYEKYLEYFSIYKRVYENTLELNQDLNKLKNKR